MVRCICFFCCYVWFLESLVGCHCPMATRTLVYCLYSYFHKHTHIHTHTHVHNFLIFFPNFLQMFILLRYITSVYVNMLKRINWVWGNTDMTHSKENAVNMNNFYVHIWPLKQLLIIACTMLKCDIRTCRIEYEDGQCYQLRCCFPRIMSWRQTRKKSADRVWSNQPSF